VNSVTRDVCFSNIKRPVLGARVGRLGSKAEVSLPRQPIDRIHREIARTINHNERGRNIRTLLCSRETGKGA